MARRFLLTILLVMLPPFMHSSWSFDTSQANAAKKAEPRAVGSAAVNYRMYCAHCHGFAGRPTGLVEIAMPEIPDFTLAQWADYEANDFYESIADGVGQMPPFKAILSREEIKRLSALVVRLPLGSKGSLVEKKWKYTQADQKLIEKLTELQDRRKSLRQMK